MSTYGALGVGSLLTTSMQPFTSNNSTTVEHVTAEMSFSALYLHALHKRRVEGGYMYQDTFPDSRDMHERMMWRTNDMASNLPSEETQSQVSVSNPISSNIPYMPNIPESEQEPQEVSRGGSTHGSLNSLTFQHPAEKFTLSTTNQISHPHT